MPGKKSKKARKQKKITTKYTTYSCALCDHIDVDEMVLCDRCDQWFHFTCANLQSITEEEPWQCEKCTTKTINEWIDPPVNTLIVHQKEPLPQRKLHQSEITDELEHAHSQSNPLSDRRFPQNPSYEHLSYRSRSPPVQSSNRFKNLSEQSASRDAAFFERQSQRSHISQRRLQIEMERIEEERYLQVKRDHEKEIRDKEYIERKYRLLMREQYDNEQRSSVDRTQFTESWIEETSNVKNLSNLSKRSSYHSIDSMAEFYRRIDELNMAPTPVKTIKPEEVITKVKSPHVSPVNPQEVKQVGEPKSSGERKENIYLDSDFKTLPQIVQQFEDKPNVLIYPSQKIMKQADQNVQTLTKGQLASRQVVTKDLPRFYGEPEDWPSFISRYQNSTNLCGFSEAENLDRLQKCLKGNALENVKHLLLMPNSVPKIISTLRMLYGRPEIIVNQLITKVKQLPAPKIDKLETLVNYAMSVNNVTSTIVAADLVHHLSNPTLIYELVEKFPSPYKVEWARFKANQPSVNMSTFSEWLYKLAEDISSVTIPNITKPQEAKYDKKKDKKESERLNTHNELKRNNENNKATAGASEKTQVSCKICRKGCHKIEDCNVFKDYQVDQRWKAMMENKLCRRCLRPHGGFCRSSKRCGVNDCIFKHHTLLHDEKRYSSVTSKPSDNTKSISTEAESVSTHISFNQDTILRVIPVKLYNNNGPSIDTFAFIDEGSTTTLINQNLADELKILGIRKKLCLIWSGKIHRIEENSRRIEIGISAIHDDKVKFQLKDVRTVKNLGLPAQTLKKDELSRKFSHLKNIPFSEYNHGIPGILIGSNNSKIGVPIQIVEGGDFEPVAYKTRIGWTIHGPTCTSNPNAAQINNSHNFEECLFQHEYDEQLHQRMKEYFTVENFGVKVNSDINNQSNDDQRAVALLKTLTRRCETGFETGLLWRKDEINLPQSYGMARRRLECLENQKPTVIQTINDIIDDYIKKGYARKLLETELMNKNIRIWYLPIFTVKYPKKPDKVRMVFDAAAKIKGVSLNSQLLKGPDQLTSLIDIYILRRFREKRIAISGDIREMYHQIKIITEDQNCQRFLWRYGDKQREPDTYVMNVMTFGATCSPSSAQYVKNLNASEFQTNYPRAVEAITKNHYVDDWMDTTDTEEQMIQLIKDVKMIHTKGGFEIRNFLSNSKAVLTVCGSKTHTESKNITIDREIGIERVLGMWWNTATDNFTFSLKFTPINKEILSGITLPTKRQLLKILMSIFDPLGLISHYLIHLKILIQEIWRSDLSWDETISKTNLIESWEKWINLLPKVEEIQIPRIYSTKLSPNFLRSVELHTFVDASEKAFAAVSYLRVEDENGIDCALVGSKSRVAPLKYLSIPRKELQSAVLGTRLSTSINSSQSFKVSRIVFWTDSETILSWLFSDHRKYHQFVAHRVGEILENSNLSDWRWVPSKQNVADEMTKWSKIPEFQSTSRWFNGPEFLRLGEENWPTKVKVDAETMEDMKLHCVHSELIICRLFDPTRFSNWNRLVRAVAYAIRYVNILRAKVRKEPIIKNHISQEELMKSRNIIFRQAQFDEYPEEMVTLELNKGLQENQRNKIKKTSQLYGCSPYMDQSGVIRIRGRIDSAENISYDTKRPVILPKTHRITRLLVGCYHRIYHHRNHETVLNEIFQRFYISRLRTVLKSVIRHDCQWCQNKNASPKIPEMGNLPKARLAIGFRSFSCIGIDYFGPMSIIHGRRVEKRWGVLLTCLTTRAIHIEIAHTLTTESCIMCLRNFMNIRGRPNEIYSDSGSNFKGADNELTKLVASINVEELATEFTTCYSKWHFNPPSTAHMGGSWERLIGTVKTCLNTIMPTRKPTDEMLRSLLLEVQNVVNSRPLTFVALDNRDDEVLTPNHFLLGSSNGIQPPGKFNEEKPILRSAWQEIQRLTDLFWQRFIKEYLPTLTRRSKWFENVKPLAIGDIVLIIDEKNSRNCYPKAKIIDIIMGSNGQVRKAKVETWSYQYGSKRDKYAAVKSVYWRPAVKLARLYILPIEGSLADKPKTSETGGSVTDGSPVSSHALTTLKPIVSESVTKTG